MSDEDFMVIAAMRKYGGQFVKSLATAATHADEQNLYTLKNAWPHYWAKYRAMAEAEREAA